LGSEPLLFYAFGALAILSSLLVIGQRNPIYSVLLLIASFGALSGLYVLLDAPFVAVIQIIVYAGAIMVLFLFVIMLLGVDSGVPVRERLLIQRPLAFILGAAFVVELFLAIRAGVGFATRAPDVFTANDGGNTQAVAKVLFTQYFFPFEVTSVLLLVAAIASMVLAHRKAPTVTQAEIDAAAGEPDADEMPVYGAGAAP
jgi:NADH-quinone oxidoreductase subunit J